MKIFVEDISDNSAENGVSTYSLIHGMDFYYAEVRADGIRLFNKDGFDDGVDLDEDSDMQEPLRKAVMDEIIKTTKGEQ